MKEVRSATDNPPDILTPGTKHLRAVLQALFVTFLWSTSYVVIKLGLQDMPAIVFGGLRYSLAFLCLLPLALRGPSQQSILSLSWKAWAFLATLGLLFYTVTQGSQFLGLAFLPAATVSLLLSFTPVVVALIGVVALGEQPTGLQLGGVFLFLIGIVTYFYPMTVPVDQLGGLLAVGAGVLAGAASAIMGRGINRLGQIPPVVVTTVSMGIGSLALLASGLVLQELPSLGLANWACIGWLALMNTALAFTLWNHTLRTLSAVESSLINSTMLPQIAVLGWLFLGESLAMQQIVGMILGAAGALLAQLRRR